MTRSEWLLAEDRALIRALYRENMTAAQVAELRGTSARAVRRRAHTLVQRLLSPRYEFVARRREKWGPTRARVAVACVLQGRTLRGAAEHLKLSLHTVRRHMDAVAAQQEALRLHGLSDRQVQQIGSERRLLRELQIVVPFPDRHSDGELKLTRAKVQRVGFQEAALQPPPAPQPEKAPLVLTELNVHKGQAVAAGETLCVLSDMRHLYIEGQAFEQDMGLLEHAANKDWPISAIQPTNGREPVVIDNLKVAYLDNTVNAETRALRFYVGLPNSIVRSTESEDGQLFIGWKFKPGQRMQLRVPVEEWPERIVLPVDAGAKVIVADHHLAGETLPDCAAVVNPNRHDDDSGMGHLCAAGVVFLLLIAANRLRRAAGETTPDLMAALDLVALATVADVAPLIGVNRAFVRQGLKVMAGRNRAGLRALADVAGVAASPNSFHLGYLLGPRVNAGGRIGKADLGARLLSTGDPAEAAALAERLDKLNAERRAIEAAVLDAASVQAEARGVEGGLVWAAGKGWHPGVVGIFASRLKERFNRPAIVIGLDGAEGKGSGRSISGVDLGSCVAAATSEGLLLKGGGHRMAAGLTVAAHKVEPAMARLDALLSAQGADRAGRADLHVLGAMAPGGATVEVVEQLEQAGPFGPSNPAPRLAFPSVLPSGVRIVGNGHAQVRFGGPGGVSLPAIAFGAADNGLADLLTAAASERRPVHVAGRLEIDDWGGRRKAKLRLEDVAAAE